jgi:division protein CdvB (Snf7/Vps24/ESCRT-III family)
LLVVEFSEELGVVAARVLEEIVAVELVLKKGRLVLDTVMAVDSVTEMTMVDVSKEVDGELSEVPEEDSVVLYAEVADVA